MNVILSIFGIIFLVWIFIVFLWTIIIHIVYKFTDGCKYTYLRRSTVIYETDYDEWYIIPSFSFHIEPICKYPTITFIWLKWQFVVHYHFQTEDEETIEVRTRREYLKEKD